MFRKLGIWAAIVAVVFASLFAAAPGVLKAAHVHWPVWPVALAGAILTALAAAAKPVADTVTQRWAARTGLHFERHDRARQLERGVGGQVKGLPRAGEITDRALLGIHPAIPLPADADPSLSPDLPLYIPRDIDADLRTWITAHRESGGFLLLAGPAAAGKTRCAYELARDTLANWPIFMPSTASQLTQYIQADPRPGKLVIWLNETQKFLGPDGLTAATIRRILVTPWPAIIIGTIWPQHYDALTSRGLAIGDASDDTREILTMLAQRKDLLPSFSDAEHDRAVSLAARDPRIAEALGASPTFNLPETLAAAPDLISRWLTAANPYGAAVITAAVTARRCGYPGPLPPDILKPLGEAVLKPADRARAEARWFQPALDWARACMRGGVSPLTPQATTPGVIEGDHVSDVLVQHAARNPSAPGHTIPQAIWLLLIEHATPNACSQIANVAYWHKQKHRSPVFTDITERAIRKAADAGHAGAMYNLGVLLDEQGNTEEAERWCRTAADAGHTGAMSNLGVLLNEQGNTEEAERWCRTAADAGHTDAMHNLGVLLSEQGNTEEAERWYRTAADAGHTGAMSNLGVLLRKKGNTEEAERWYRTAADAGHTGATYNLGVLLSEQGNTEEAERWYRTAADAGHANAMSNLGVLLNEQGNTEEAERWYRTAADAGHADAMSNLGVLLNEQGNTEEAERWWRTAADAGHADAMSNLGVLLRKKGNTEEAERWWRTAADAGHADAMSNLGGLPGEETKPD